MFWNYLSYLEYSVRISLLIIFLLKYIRSMSISVVCYATHVIRKLTSVSIFLHRIRTMNNNLALVHTLYRSLIIPWKRAWKREKIRSKLPEKVKLCRLQAGVTFLLLNTLTMNSIWQVLCSGAIKRQHLLIVELYFEILILSAPTAKLIYFISGSSRLIPREKRHP